MNITSYNEEEVTNMKRIATAILVLESGKVVEIRRVYVP
jgi:hypothetical protein